MLHRSYYVLLTTIIALLVLPACDFLNDNDNPDANEIRIRDNSFDPPVLTVGIGRTVVWRNEAQNPHTVTSGSPGSNPGALFDSGTLNPAGGFSFLFNETGNYPYFCRVHGSMMSGTIQVR